MSTVNPDGSMPKEYVGDGLYAHCDGHQFWLTCAPRANGECSVALNPDTLINFIAYVMGHSAGKTLIQAGVDQA